LYAGFKLCARCGDSSRTDLYCHHHLLTPYKPFNAIPPTSTLPLDTNSQPAVAEASATTNLITSATVVVSGTSVIVTTDVGVTQQTTGTNALSTTASSLSSVTGFIEGPTSASTASSGISQGQNSADTAVIVPTASATAVIDSGSRTGPAVSIAAIGGGVAAAVVILLLIIFMNLWRRRRQSRAKSHHIGLTEPAPTHQYLDKPCSDEQTIHITPYTPAASGILPAFSPTSGDSARPIDHPPAKQIPSDSKIENKSPLSEIGAEAGVASSSQDNPAQAYSSWQQVDEGSTLPPDYDAAITNPGGSEPWVADRKVGLQGLWSRARFGEYLGVNIW